MPRRIVWRAQSAGALSFGPRPATYGDTNMILDDILSDYAASIATLALGLSGEPDEVVDRVTGILRANARDDISAHAIIDAFHGNESEARHRTCDAINRRDDVPLTQPFTLLGFVAHLGAIERDMHDWAPRSSRRPQCPLMPLFSCLCPAMC